MLFPYYKLACYFCFALAAVWFFGAFATKSTARRQDGGSRLVQSALTIFSLELIFNPKLWHGWLMQPFLTPTNASGALGLLFTALGVVFAIWARITLGSNWSGSVTVKHDHTLVRRGPYAIVRHPIYTGWLLGSLGMTIIVGEVRGVVGTVILFVGFWYKYRTEENFMIESFGDEYRTYQREVKALIPWVF